MEANVKPFLAESIDRQIFLKRMNECWQAHCRQMIQIRSIFLYLDRTYVLQNASIVSIWYAYFYLYAVSHLQCKFLIGTWG